MYGRVWRWAHRGSPALVILGISTLLACQREREIDTLLADYFVAYDARAAAFCHCFSTFVGYASTNDCEDAQALDPVQTGCITGIFAPDPDDPPPEFSSAPAIACLTEVESDHRTCLGELICEDIKGLDDCINARNEALLACPRLSEDDTGKFEQCLLL